MTSTCPECAREIAVAETIRLSQIVECPDCKSELELVSTQPVILALAPEPEEDWGE